MIELKTWQEELEDCRAAAAAHPGVEIYLSVHHDIFCERLTEPLESRIKAILDTKPQEQWACRFRNLRPLTFELPAAFDKARAAFAKAWAACAKAEAAFAKAEAARAKAWADYVKALAARDKAWAACGPELKQLLDAAWPGNTWNGKNIGWA